MFLRFPIRYSLFAIRYSLFAVRYSLFAPRPLSRHQRPVVEVEQDRGIILAAGLERKVRARMILGGDGAQPQRADIVPPRPLRLGAPTGARDRPAAPHPPGRAPRTKRTRWRPQTAATRAVRR